MTFVTTKSESGAELTNVRRSSTLGAHREFRVEGQWQFRAAPVRGGTWVLAPSTGVEVFFTPSHRRGTPGCSGLPWRAREKLLWRWEKDSREKIRLI